MNQQNFNATITVSNTANEAFNGINDVSKWWTKNTVGSSKNIDDVFTVTFGETFAIFKIIEMVAGKKVVWLTTDCNLHWMKDKKEWKGTKMSFEISTKDNATQIHFTHVGLVPEIECFTDCSAGWTHYITKSLFKLLTEQTGLPDDANYSAIERQ
ncbi:MAG TPA: hypothetical protein VKC90_02380 [Chitinophagaceae bacterium]|nr:hypothetical protein [Chitinophagaceae bacterium]